jgi:hypothetical protein
LSSPLLHKSSIYKENLNPSSATLTFSIPDAKIKAAVFILKTNFLFW